MSTALPDPLRIICTKCVRIVRVHFQEAHPAMDLVLVATECCKRLFGRVHVEVLLSATCSGRDLTTNDIESVQDMEASEREAEERAALYASRAAAIRWARGVAP